MKGISHSLSLAVMLLCFSKLRFSLFEQLEIKLQPKERVDQEDGPKELVVTERENREEISIKVPFFNMWKRFVHDQQFTHQPRWIDDDESSVPEIG